MKVAGIIKAVAVGLAVVGFCMPQSVLAASPGNQPSGVVNVSLTKTGVLLGQVVDTSGLPKSKIPVTIQSGKQKLAVGTTDKNGYFAFRGVRGGTYQLTAAKGQGVYRVWTNGTAPPKTQQGALLVSGKDLVRAQQQQRRRGGGLFGGDGGGSGGGGGGGLGTFLANPLVIGGIAASAILVPVVVHNAKDSDTPLSP